MTRRSWTGPAGAAAIVLALLLAYANSFHGPFVFDDPSSITGNATIRDLRNVGAILRTPHATVSAEGRPVLNLSLALNYAAGKEAVEGYHRVNLAIHVAAALVLLGVLHRVFLLAPRLRPQAGALAWALTLLWAVHPLQTESVTYVIQRAEALMGLFYLLCLYAFLRRAAGGGVGWSLLAFASALLGMATKEDMVSAPVAVFACDALLVAGSFADAWRRRWRLHLALASSWILLAWLIAGTGGNRGGSVGFGLDVDWTSYWLTQLPAIRTYLGLAFWPHPLVFEYGAFWLHRLMEVWPDALLVGALLAGSLWALARAPLIGFAAVCFWGILAPTSLVPGTTQMIVEHRMYLPLVSVLAVPAALAALRWPRATRAVLVAAAAAGIALTALRNRDYRDARGLWEKTVRQRPDNVLAWVMLGDVLRHSGRGDEALDVFRRAVRMRPRFPLAQESLGELLLQRGQVEEAMEHLREAMRLRPTYADPHYNLALAFERRNEWGPAVGQLRRAVALRPDWAGAREELARAQARRRERQEAP